MATLMRLSVCFAGPLATGGGDIDWGRLTTLRRGKYEQMVRMQAALRLQIIASLDWVLLRRLKHSGGKLNKAACTARDEDYLVCDYHV